MVVSARLSVRRIEDARTASGTGGRRVAIRGVDISKIHRADCELAARRVLFSSSTALAQHRQDKKAIEGIGPCAIRDVHLSSPALHAVPPLLGRYLGAGKNYDRGERERCAGAVPAGERSGLKHRAARAAGEISAVVQSSPSIVPVVLAASQPVHIPVLRLSLSVNSLGSAHGGSQRGCEGEKCVEGCEKSQCEASGRPAAQQPRPEDLRGIHHVRVGGQQRWQGDPCGA
mmetsp:Transcript_40366/g.127011  ORF Transcript_40366/g.127011 Transcript_40366/m.127011 type:complete len:230 (+) Transcript_40366:522-1211(+)